MSQSTTTSSSSASNTASQTYGPHPLPWPRYQPVVRPSTTASNGASTSLFRTRSQSHSAPRWNPMSIFRTRLSGSVSGPSSQQPSSSSNLSTGLHRASSSSSTRRYSAATLPSVQSSIFPEAESLSSPSDHEQYNTTISQPTSTVVPGSALGASPPSSTFVESPDSSSWTVHSGLADSGTTSTPACILIPQDDQQPRTIPDFGDIKLPTPLSLQDFSLFSGAGCGVNQEDLPIISPGLNSPTSQFGFTGLNVESMGGCMADEDWMSLGVDSGVEMMDEYAGVETVQREPPPYVPVRNGVDLGLGTGISLENVLGVETPEPLKLLANAVYYPNWHIYKGRTPSSLPLGVISHIFYSFAHVREDGTVFLSDEWADLNIDVDNTKGCLPALRALKGKHPHVKTILSIGGGAASQNFASVASSPTKRATFAQSARALVVTHGLDGIDIDWEHPSNATEGHDFVSLLRTTREYLPASTYILTAALPATEWHLKNIPLAQSIQYLTFLNLMTYDFFGPWSDRAGHHSQLYPHPSDPSAPSVASAIEYLTSRSIPPSKILLGIPTYGRSFTSCSAPGGRFAGHAGEEGTFECVDLPRPGSKVIRDRERGTVACVGGDGGWIGYEDGETVRAKGSWARKRGLGGVFYWTGHGGEYVNGQSGLVGEGFRGLHGG